VTGGAGYGDKENQALTEHPYYLGSFGFLLLEKGYIFCMRNIGDSKFQSIIIQHSNAGTGCGMNLNQGQLPTHILVSLSK
jgi:hypothetical protein